MKRCTQGEKRNARRGFCVAEVIVALAVIVTVSAAALTLIFAQIRTDTEAASVFAATNMAENAVECFRFARDTKEDLGELLERCGYSVSFADGRYTAERDGVFGEITVTPSESRSELEITVKNGKGDVLVSVEHYKK